MVNDDWSVVRRFGLFDHKMACFAGFSGRKCRGAKRVLLKVGAVAPRPTIVVNLLGWTSLLWKFHPCSLFARRRLLSLLGAVVGLWRRYGDCYGSTGVDLSV